MNWYAPSSNLKLMCDRLVCMNRGNPREDLIKHKDPELAMKLERREEWRALGVNHLEGRTAAFFCYGDAGGDELDTSGRPNILLHKDGSTRSAPTCATAMRLVWHCRYGGMEVPEDLWPYHEFGREKPYSLNEAEHMATDPAAPMSEAEAFAARVVTHVARKGKVPPGKYRAFGRRPARHGYADLRLAWREARMRLGKPRPGSSPAKQQEAGLNDDVTLRPKKSDRDKGSE